MEIIPVESETACTDRFPCPYFRDGRVASVEFVVGDAFSRKTFDRFLSKGYRRLGRILYRNVCSGCTECIPVRVDVETFRTGRSAGRTIRRNRDLEIHVTSPPTVTPEKLVLYENYLRLKHRDPDVVPDSSIPAVYSMHYGYDSIIEMDYYHGEKLIGVGIVDEGAESLSANYFYYDTGYLDRRPGIFSIQQEILLAKKMGKRYYYLGFYIESIPAMSYKKDFRPNQILVRDAWTDFLA